jgi:hypothetical protein
MMDEAVLQALLAQAGDEIPVPAAGPERVLNALATVSGPSRGPRPRFTKPLMAAAATILIALVAVPVLASRSTTGAKHLAVSAPTGSPAKERSVTNAPAGLGGNVHGVTATFPSSRSFSRATAPSGPVDAAKIVKTGTLDLQVPRSTLRTAANRVTSATVGLGGYVASSRTSYDGTNPTAQITVRVPAPQFEAAIARLRAMPGVKVLADGESGTDVTAQYADLEAQLTAATAGRDALLVVLSRADTVGDILAVQDRVTAAQSTVDQLQGRINVLNDQSSYSSLAITLSEKPAHAATTAARVTPPSGISKAWADGRQGFTNGIEWLIARSGGALIVLLAGIALLFGIRYLYPIVRRGLV